jgi:acyl carrier protein
MNATEAQKNEKLSNLIAWFQKRKPTIGQIRLDQDLIETRALDSLSFTDLIYYLEELTDQEIDIEREALPTFRTLAAISSRFFEQGTAQ